MRLIRATLFGCCWVAVLLLSKAPAQEPPLSLSREWSLTRLEGRRFERDGWGIGLSLGKTLRLSYGEERFFALGRDRANRFEVDWIRYGLRLNTGWQRLSAEYQAYRPRNARATSPGSEAIYNATQIDKISFARDPFQLSLAWIKGSERSATSLGLGWLQRGSFGAWATWQVTPGVQIDFPSRVPGRASSAHPFFQGKLCFPLVWGLALETELELWLSGLSYASSSLSPLSSFLLYEPGGAVRDLQRKPFGWIVFRIVFDPKEKPTTVRNGSLVGSGRPKASKR